MKPSAFLFYMRRYAPVILVILSAAVAVVSYLQALNAPLFSDDLTYIVKNTKLAGLHWSELWRLFIEPYNSMVEFLPLRELSYWFDMTLFGLNPSAFRLHNIILYLLGLPLVYATTLSLWRYFRSTDTASAPWAAAAITALFALHPAFVESVVWVSSRKYVLANLFAMLALWLAVNVRREQGFSVPHATATLIAFVAVMLSKSSYAAVAPIIAMLWLLFWLDIPKPNRHRILLLWPLAVLLLAVLLLGVFIINSTTGGPNPYYGIETIIRPLAILGWLARLAVSPESRHYFYPVFEDPYLYGMVTLGATVLLAAMVGLVMFVRKRSLEGFALVAFLLLCMPYLQMFPYVSPSLVQDRYLALAALPIIFIIVALAWRLKLVYRTVLLFVIAFLWGFQTIDRPRDWRSFEALTETDFHAFPGYSMPAMYKLENQLSEGLIREAGETAEGISIPEVRNTMLKLVKVHQAVTDARVTGDTHQAMDALLALGLDLKRMPTQARWNTPLIIMWRMNRIYLRIEWQDMVRNFPDDALLRENAKLALLGIWKYEDTIVGSQTVAKPQQ